MCDDTMTYVSMGLLPTSNVTRFPTHNHNVCGDMKIFIVITYHKCNNMMNNVCGDCITMGAKSSCWLSAITQRIPRPPSLSLLSVLWDIA